MQEANLTPEEEPAAECVVPRARLARPLSGTKQTSYEAVESAPHTPRETPVP